LNAAIQKFGLYAIVADMDRSRAFYERLFEAPPVMQNNRIVAFDVAGGLYVLFSAAASGREVVRGNNIVAFIRVADIEHEFARVKALGATLLDDAVVHEAPLALFRFADLDGNVLEFYAIMAR
jgi:predicted enzyme related to lactoylglutathione lyase